MGICKACGKKGFFLRVDKQGICRNCKFKQTLKEISDSRNNNASAKNKEAAIKPYHSESIESVSANQLQFMDEQQALVKKISDFTGSTHITQSDVRKYTIHNIEEDFSAMSGWDIWDASIHEFPGQYERLERSLRNQIVVLAYDSTYRLAKMQGQSSVYLTSHNRCSCPDFRERHLPCKHMYALALVLEGDVETTISDSTHLPLYGLTFAIAGRFAGSRDGADGIRAKIDSRGGIWLDNISRDCSALLAGNGASSTKLVKAESLDMEIVSEHLINRLFDADA